MWLEFIYQPTTLFTLKASDATNSAGKSLLNPSPYAVKMALLNAICTFDSVSVAEDNFDLIRDLEIQFALPEYIAVNNCFIKIIKKDDHPKGPEDLFKSTVAFREFIYFAGDLKVAVQLPANFTQSQVDFLNRYFLRINYFGKRASFFQLISIPQDSISELGHEYSRDIKDKSFHDGRAKILMKVDDFDNDIKFENVNTYSDKKTKRVSKIIFLPFNMVKANKNFTILQRHDNYS